MTHRPGREAIAAIGYGAGWRQPRRSLAQFRAAAGDGLLAVLIVLAAGLAWSPRLGVAVARETVTERRRLRAHLAEIQHAQTAVWVRHARRLAARGGAGVAAWRRSAADP